MRGKDHADWLTRGPKEWVHAADLVFVLEHQVVVSREGDCEWLEEGRPIDAAEWVLTCLKTRRPVDNFEKPQAIGFELAQMLQSFADYSGWKIKDTEAWIICLVGMSLYMDERRHRTQLVTKAKRLDELEAETERQKTMHDNFRKMTQAPAEAAEHRARKWVGSQCSTCGKHIVACTCTGPRL